MKKVIKVTLIVVTIFSICYFHSQINNWFRKYNKAQDEFWDKKLKEK